MIPPRSSATAKAARKILRPTGTLLLNTERTPKENAISVAIGMAIQNFPEGAIVSMPLKESVKSPWKAFGYGVGSGIVEPLAGLVTILFLYVLLLSDRVYYNGKLEIMFL